jgi:16S rRNA (guanine966-N2)-methyltransferase
VREALFGILGSAGVVEGARVLDLYAGSGALAIEALSRGAVRAVLVESSREALSVARANVLALGLEERALVVFGDASTLARPLAGHGPFDLLLADPPWVLVEEGVAQRALSRVVRAGALRPSACVVLEHAARTIPPEVDGLVRTETRRYGDTALTFYKPAILGAPRTDV